MSTNRNRITQIVILIFLIVLTLSFAGCGTDKVDQEDGQDDGTLEQKYGPVFESFSTTDIYGNPQDESMILNSRYTLVLIWSTTCNPCIEGMPKMEALYQEYKDIGINIMGIVVDIQDQNGDAVASTVADAVSIIETKGVTFTNTQIPAPIMTFLYDEIQYTPTAFFVDNTGTIVSELYIGEKEYDEWSEAIEELIK
jgi:thiol-disulfide isomerase/thioredoxin